MELPSLPCQPQQPPCTPLILRDHMLDQLRKTQPLYPPAAMEELSVIDAYFLFCILEQLNDRLLQSCININNLPTIRIRIKVHQSQRYFFEVGCQKFGRWGECFPFFLCPCSFHRLLNPIRYLIRYSILHHVSKSHIIRNQTNELEIRSSQSS